MLARVWEWPDDPTGFFLSEKLDGIRAKWTGRALISREGFTLNAPPWFTAQLPADVALDGELWAGRGRSHLDVSAIAGPQRDTGAAWRALTFCAFDIPAATAGTFAQRLNALRFYGFNSANVRTVEHVRCAGRAHFLRLFAEITSAGGEGVMLRRASGLYKFGRSSDLLKAKPFAA
jgi:DNA ligase-1